jgi:hypothetical protein
MNSYTFKEKLGILFEAFKDTVELREISPSEKEKILSLLSDKERNMLGQQATKSRKFPPVEVWPYARDVAARIAMQKNKNLKDPYLTGYTPGETVSLLKHNKVVEWHNAIMKFKIPDEYDFVAFVPCGANKSWGNPKGVTKYKDYHEIKNKYKIYIVTVSEPLGVVPMERWSDFLQYDNPGLFKSSPQRTYFDAVWKRLFGEVFVGPWDENSYKESIKILGKVIETFVENNLKEGRQFISFVDGHRGNTSHGDMLNILVRNKIPNEYRFTNTEKSGRGFTPLPHMNRILDTLKVPVR